MKRLLAIAASLALLVWFASDARWHGLVDTFGRLSAPSLAGGVIGLGMSYLLRAGRVYDEFRHDAKGRLGACLRIVLIHNAMVNVVPFRGGEAAFPILLGRNFGTPLGRAVASLFWFRLQDALIVAVLAVAVWPGLALPLRTGGIFALVAFAWYLPRWARAPHAWAERGGTAAKLAKLRDAFAASTRHARFGWLWTLANWSVKLGTQAWLLAALLPASPAVGAAGALGAELAAILPVQGVAGFGTYEAGAAAALLPHAISFDGALQAALALHLFVIACAVASGALAWLMPTPPVAPATAERSPLSGNR